MSNILLNSPGSSSESELAEEPAELDDDDEGGAAKLGEIMLAAVWMRFPPNKLLIGPAPEPPEAEAEDACETDDDGEAAFITELTAFWTPGNMPGLNNGFSVVPGGPSIDCIAWSAIPGVPEAEPAELDDPKPAEPWMMLDSGDDEPNRPANGEPADEEAGVLA